MPIPTEPKLYWLSRGCSNAWNRPRKDASSSELDPSQDHAHPRVEKMEQHLFRPAGRKQAIPVGEKENLPSDLSERAIEGGLLARSGRPVRLDCG